MSDLHSLSLTARRSIEVSQALDIHQDNIIIYFTYLDNLKHFQEKHLAAQADLLDMFYDLSIYQLIHEKNYSGGVYNPLLTLLRSLSALKDAIPKDPDSCFYAASCEALLQAICLAKRMISQLPYNTAGTAKLEFQEKINALTFTVKSATAVILNPRQALNYLNLQRNTEVMREWSEGKHAKSSFDHPINNTFAAALEVLSGLALLMIGSLMLPASLALGAATFAYGLHCIWTGSKRFIRARDPWAYYTPAATQLAQQSITTSAALQCLANNHKALFFQRRPAVKNTAGTEVELQSLARALAL